MTPRKWLAICALACATLGRAETKWIRMQSPNFEVYSSADERGTRDTLRFFERVRDFFLQTNHQAPSKPVPVYVVIFGSEKEYAPYRFNQFATAYYQPGADRDYIVMSHAGAETAQVATHEYVHLVLRHGGVNVPPWLGEGLAELYSTFISLDDKVIVGGLIAGRMQALNTDKWVPLAAILNADQKSAYYNEKDKAGSLYNEGWALVHMLQLTPEYAPKFQDLVKAIAKGTPSIAALESAYGKPVSAIEKDLQLYVRGNRFRGLQYPVKLDAVKDAFPVSAAPMFDVKFALANLTNRPGAEQETQRKFEDLKQEDPKRPEPWAGLAYLAWRQQKMPEAVENFAQAYTLGGHSAKLLWDYGRLAENGHTEDSVKVLTELLTLEPENVDARIELATGHMNARRPVQALATLQPVTNVSPEQAPRLFYMMGFARMQLGDIEEAKAAAKKLAEYARTTQEHMQADQLLSYLEGRTSGANASTRIAPATLTEEPAESKGPTELKGPPRLAGTLTVAGTLLEFTCARGQNGFVLGTPDGKRKFAIDNPKGILITGAKDYSVEFKCGALKPAQVRLEYVPVTDRAGISGSVRAIHFEP